MKAVIGYLKVPRDFDVCFLQKDAKLKLSCNTNLLRPIDLLVENQNNKYNSGIAAGGRQGAQGRGGPKLEID